MKNFSKIVSLVAVFALSLTILSGCAVDELTLLNALCKQPDINSYESKTELTVKLTSEGLKGSDKESFEQIAPIVNDSKIILNQKFLGNPEKTILKSQSDFSLDLGGVILYSTYWAESDLTGDDPKVRSIVKIPPILTKFIPSMDIEDMSNKKYFVMDMNNILSTDISAKSGRYTKEYMEYTRNLTPKFIDFIKAYARQFNPGFSIVTSKGIQTVDNQTVTVYTLKLDDASFKKLLSYSVTNFAQNESAKSFIKNLILDYISLSGLPYRERLKAQGEINRSFDEFNTNLPEFLKDWENVMSVLNDVRILGDKGISIDFGINRDGYIVSQKGTMEFIIDLKEINDAYGKYYSLSEEDYIVDEIENKETIKCEVNFNTEINKINQKVVIDIPDVTTENSMGLTDLMEVFINMSPDMGGQFAPDTTPPDAPTVNKVLQTSKAVSGNTEAYSIITIKKVAP